MAKRTNWTGCVVLKPDDGDWSGAKSGVINATFLADQIWPGVQYGNAFAYLFRRFGETGPFDWHKQLCNYDLTTPDEEVGFWLSCCPSSVGMEPGFWLADRLHREIMLNDYRKACDWPLADPSGPDYGTRIPPEGTASRRAIDAIAEGMRDLFRPVYVRDVPINIMGKMTDADAGKLEPAEHAWND